MRIKVRVTKLQEIQKGPCNFPIGYSVVGYLTSVPSINSPLFLYKANNQKKNIVETFQTTNIKNIEENVIKTLNSIYQIEYLDS